MKTLDNSDHLDFFNVLYHTGMRVMEACRMSFHAINRDEGTITVNRYNTGDTSVIDMTRLVREILERRFDDPDRHSVYVFADKFGKKHRSSSNSWWKSAVAKTSVNSPEKLNREMYPDNHGEVATPHHIRHLYASKLARSGKFTLEEIGERLNHEDVRSTARYIKFLPRTNAQKAVDVLDALGE